MQTSRKNDDDEFAWMGEVLEWMKAGQTLRARGEKSGFALPAALRAISAGRDAALDPLTKKIERVPFPVAVPKGIGDDWIWLGVDEVALPTLVCAVLGEHSRSLKTEQLFAEISKYRKLGANGLANTATALEEARTVTRRDGTWTLARDIVAPIIQDKFVLGPPKQFSRTDIPIFRRRMLPAVLREFPDGLQQFEIVKVIAGLDWIPGPKDKDAVKIDMRTLAGDGYVVRDATMRWKLTARGVNA